VLQGRKKLAISALWPYLGLTAVVAAAARPLAEADMVCSDDGAFHLFRAVELGSLLELGHLLPRWAPHMAQGYGFPFYNYYAPLSSYVVVLLHFAGLAYPAALEAAFGLGLWLSAVGAFLFARRLFGTRAGVAAGAAYALAPYVAFDILFRANLAESFAFVWPPLVLWALHRLGERAARGTPPGFAPAAALGYAALILTHNIFALVASPLIWGYALLLAWQRRSWRLLGASALSLAAGIALSAYFWLPAIAERNLVHSDRLLVPPTFTWYTNFISAGELLQPPHAEDPLLVNPSPTRAIGLLPALLSLPAVGLAAWTAVSSLRRARRAPPPAPPAHAPGAAARREPASTVLFFGAALFGYGAMTVPVSEPVWRLIGPLELVQFPWRMLGPGALCAAALIGASVEAAERLLGRALGGKRQGAGRRLPPYDRYGLAALPLAGAAALLLLGNLAWWYPRYCPTADTADVSDLVGYEQATRTIGTTAKGEYLPRTSDFVPEDGELASALQQGQEPPRLWLPEGAGTIVAADARDPLDASYAVELAQAATVLYRQFYFPGWRVSVDGQPAAIAPSEGAGLIEFAVPAGAHRIRAAFGLTPLRGAAVAVSALTLAAMGVWAVKAAGGRRREAGVRPEAYAAAEAGEAAAPGWTHAAALVWLVGLALLKLVVIDAYPTPFRRSLLSAEAAPQADFADGLRLYRAELDRLRLPADGAVEVVMDVGLWAPSERRFWPAVAIEDAAGAAWNDPEPMPPRWHREPSDSPLWPLDQYAQWARRVPLLPGTPPGRYTFFAWVIDHDTFQILSVLDENGSALAPRLALGELEVTRPAAPAALAPARPAARAFGPIELLGYDVDREALNAGEALRVSLFWRSLAATEADWPARLALVDAQGAEAFAAEVDPANGFGTSRWRPGDAWRGQHALRVPAAVPAGAYTLAVAVPGLSAEAQPLGTIAVSAPPRTFEQPAFGTASGAAFGDVAVLEGYDVARDGDALNVTLVWRATGSPPVSYAVFVHLAGGDGRVWAQSDAVPAGWTRPTTGWLPGEYIVDMHRLALPADLPEGARELWVGVYDPQTGARLPAAGRGATEDGRVVIGDW
jgi:hypothetical protein